MLAIVVVSLAGSGCAKVQARTEPVMPLLMPPPPPPRTVEIYIDDGAPAPESGAAEGALNVPARPPARPPAARPDVPSKPEPARAEPERPGTVATQPPSLTLKPAPGSESTTQASIRRLLSSAARDLGRTDYKVLNADGRAQYDTAKGFMQQAEEALKAGNLIFAGKLADKAATMAAVLVR
jgi:hypothetical protein